MCVFALSTSMCLQRTRSSEARHQGGASPGLGRGAVHGRRTRSASGCHAACLYILYYLISLYEEIGSGYFCSVLTAVAMICTACLKEPAHTTGKAGAVGSVGACGVHSKQEVENCRWYIMNNGLRRFGEKSPKLYHSASRVTLNSRFGGCIARALAC